MLKKVLKQIPVKTNGTIAAAIESEEAIMIVAPSPDMLIVAEKCRKGIRNYHVVTDKTVADLYKHPFLEALSYSYEETF